jgi:tRNA (guanine26-N2/guanine27-N2)-dimethyltransferase
MAVGFPVEEVWEGMARLLVPALDESAGEPEQRLRSMAPVFYNPVMKTNRDTAVLVLRAHQRGLGRGVTACEPMAGSGVRGIRLALEANGVERVVMGDLSPSAIRLGELNADRNGVSDRVCFRLLDANLLLSLHCYPGGRLDYVDVDPYGSPAPFMDTAVRSVVNHGVVTFTATDMAPLCGVNPGACFRKYGAAPLAGEFCHETAVRLLIGAVVRAAAVHERAATPLFSYYSDHYVRVYCRLDRGKRRADSQLAQTGYIKYCPGCLHRMTSEDTKAEPCPSCGSETSVAGPLWLGEQSDPEFLSVMLEDSTLGYLAGSKAVRLIRMAVDEHGYPPWFYDIDSVCSQMGVRSMATEEALTRIMEAGYRVSRTHYGDRAIKTDASIVELKKVLGG